MRVVVIQLYLACVTCTAALCLRSQKWQFVSYVAFNYIICYSLFDSFSMFRWIHFRFVDQYWHYLISLLWLCIKNVKGESLWSTSLTGSVFQVAQSSYCSFHSWLVGWFVVFSYSIVSRSHDVHLLGIFFLGFCLTHYVSFISNTVLIIFSCVNACMWICSILLCATSPKN